MSLNFPEKLDGAKVLFYTPEDDFGVIMWSEGGIAAYIKYLAVCQYENSKQYYLFRCNQEFEVEGDSLWNSIEECMGTARATYGNIIWIDAKDGKAVIVRET